MPADLEQQLVEDLARFQHDPLGYVLYAFPWREPGTPLADYTGPRQWQREVLAEIGEKLRASARVNLTEIIQEAVCSGHGIGKSTLIAWLILWGLSTLEDSRIVATANTEKQLTSKTSPELAKWHRLAINGHWFTYSVTALSAKDPEHAKTWRCDFLPWSEHNTEAFAGLHNEGKRVMLLFDEASAIADKVWEVAEGAMTDANTELLWVAFGNGTRNTGRFRECFRKFRHRWSGRQIDSRTVEGTNKAQLEKWVTDYTEDSDFVKVRVRGMFPAAGGRQFISETDVDAAYGRELRPEQFNYAPKILAVDPAWTGEDPLVIGIRQGLHFRILRVVPKNDNDVQMANLVARLEDEEQADAVFIDAGYGTGIVSVGRTLGRDWVLVWFQEKPYDVGCVNKRAEIWQGAKKWLKEGGSIEPRQELRDDLTGIETVDRLDGKLLLEAKQDMKARGLPSPNFGDTLALTFAHPVQKKMRHLVTQPQQFVQWDYDPYKDAA